MTRFRGPRSDRTLCWTCALPVLLALGGCPADPDAGAPDTAPVVVHAGLQPGDRIEGLDLAVAPDGTVHMVWREWLGLYGGASSGERIMYRRGHGDPVRWEAPMLVAEDVAGSPQVVVKGDGVHVLGGPRLRHWWLPAGADRWQSQAALLGEDAPLAQEFDAVTLGDSVIVAYSRAPARGDSAVYSVHWRDEHVGEPRLVASYPASPGSRVSPSAPTLLVQADRLLLLWATNGFAEVQRGSYTAFRSDSRIHARWSADAGYHWMRAPPVNADAAQEMYIHDVGAVGAGTEPLALFAGNGLFASRWHDGEWSSPRRLAGYETGDLSGSVKTLRTAAVQCAGRPLVAWVDGRHQRSDRRWWNPLGGFPWSDSPDWINNDLFVLGGRELHVALGGGEVLPRRQTVPGSYTTDIAMVARGDHVLLLWGGRARVKKSPDDMGATPAILQRRIECGGAGIGSLQGPP